MNRYSLLEQLQHYFPCAAEEVAAKKRMIAFIEEHKDCFERSLAIGHMTASAWLLNNDKTTALLMHHAKLNKWLQLGGHCDGNEDVLAVAIKEAQEESGIQHIVPVSSDIFDIDIHRISATSHEPEHDHYDVRFLLQVTSDEKIVQNRESKELRWISKERATLPTDELSVVRLYNKWLTIYQ